MSLLNGAEVSISCHCGAAKQTVSLALSPSPSGLTCGVDLCHCDTCRHSSGLLCVSYAPLLQPPQSLSGLTAYPPRPPSAEPPADESEGLGGGRGGRLSRRYFCDRCGCHVFREQLRRQPAAPAAPSAATTAGEERTGEGEGQAWGVATGVIIGRAAAADESRSGADGDAGEERPLLRCVGHANVADTLDGGLARFVRLAGAPADPAGGERGPGAPRDDALEARCRCGTLRFRITRPDAASRLPRSNFPDLTLAYCAAPSAAVANPRDEKWWLRAGAGAAPGAAPTRYLAGTCSCRSCRVTAGFEIQTWAFVPRSNILVHAAAAAAAGGGDALAPLDFSAPAARLPLRSYESSAGVRREFCPRCGATAFWRDRWRPDLVDVAVGLLAAPEGARAEAWLDWWTARVSFAEDAAAGRRGGVAAWAKSLVAALEQGLAAWAEEKEKERERERGG
ncbi:hypothetical protein GGS23DRAFT_612805 [Durotheca rogersii]|uniref:uncharacterized protein n=1 Tax=Durotheca rogersii TaxID=419775 RepID=UPI00221E460C|nr:uncharacterized protein GGS23DRAFT_612805 [Durotheca rogersii]KAI5867677.1 hypothetical protein GGS23DRAFT_612805 [Durotheca rogersii]